MAPELENKPESERQYNPAGIGLALGLVIGGGIGMIYGFAIDNFTLGMVLGSVGGMLLGSAIGASAGNRVKK